MRYNIVYAKDAFYWPQETIRHCRTGRIKRGMILKRQFGVYYPDKTRDLDQQAFIFNSDARALKNTMWWQNTRSIVMIAIIVIVVILILAIAACGGITFSKCRKQ